MAQSNNNDQRLQDLLSFSLGFMHGEDGRVLVEKYREAIENVTPHDMLRLEDRQIQMGITAGAIKKDIEKVMNMFFKSLSRYLWEKPKQGSFLYYLMLENDAFTFRLNQVKKIIKSYKGVQAENFDAMKAKLIPEFRGFFDFEHHYVKKENILFPYLEKKLESYRPLNVMWSLHDDIRSILKELIGLLQDKRTKWKDFNRVLGKYYFLVFGMIQKENLVVYPVASEILSEADWYAMRLQSFDYPFPFIETPAKPVSESQSVNGIVPEAQEYQKTWLKSETGHMTFEQALMVFNFVPVDITVVDENDRVIFFNKAKDRFFPRSPAIIGRLVQNCHPPESVHIVEKIVEAFRNGEKDHADFWIQLKGKFILIRYFALRDSDNRYKGVLEVSQDITEIRSLEGEKRLLDWS